MTDNDPAIPTPSRSVVDEVIATNPKAVEDYHTGKPVLGFFVGQVMKATRGQANAALVQTAVRERLDAHDLEWLQDERMP